MVKNGFRKEKKAITIILIFFLLSSLSIHGLSNDLQLKLHGTYDIYQIMITDDFDYKLLIDIKCDITTFTETEIIISATPDQYLELMMNGYQITYLYDDFSDMIESTMTPETRYSFHDYNDLTTELQQIAATYPDITNLYELGQSVQGRSIWGLKITDNPDIEEYEPEIQFEGCHHGNEYMSVEMPLNLAWHLVQNYSVDPTVTDYVDNREIWIVPLVNPDGRQMSQRYNANGVDLNRDYGYMHGGSTPAPFSQQETQVMREHQLQNNVKLSYSYHTTAEYVNYVWDYKPQDSPDEPWIDMISELYADLSGYVKTQGYDWYQTTGASDDGNYGCFGNINTIIETLNSNIAYSWNNNKDAMMSMIDVADMGFSGIVTDAVTGEPINATIWVEEHNWPVFTDHEIGDYHKGVLEGTYTVHFIANGYEEQVKQITITDANASNVLDAQLVPGDGYYGYQVAMCEYFSHISNPSEGVWALGPPDNVSASLGNGGMMVVDMGVHSLIIDGTGDDFTVYEGDDTAEGYSVSVSNTFNGPWNSLGSGTGTQSFDISDVGLSEARFVKIEDDGISNGTKNYPGFDLDAIEALNLTTTNLPPDAGFTYLPIQPTTNDLVRFTDESTDSDGSIGQWLWDFGDDNTSNLQNPSHIYQNPGTYLVKLMVWDDDGESDLASKPLIVQQFGPNADFTYSPQAINPYDVVQFTDQSYDTSGDSISWWSWEFGDGNTSIIQDPVHSYSLNGSYIVNLTVMNTTGATDTISKTVTVGLISIDMVFRPGWNLITIPIMMDWYASDLISNITDCLMVSWFDAENQTFRTATGSGGYDFLIQPGWGYFVYTTSQSILSLQGPPITEVFVPLEIGWNMIGWYHENDNMASSLMDNITGCIMVSWYDNLNETYRTATSSGGYDFVIEGGMGLFVYTTDSSIWNGEG